MVDIKNDSKNSKTKVKNAVDEKKEEVKENVSTKKEDVKAEATEKKEAFISSMSGKIGTEAKEIGGKLSHEAKEFGEKIGHLPVNKKLIFFTGVILIVLAGLSLLYPSLMAFFVFLIGGGMVYIGVSDKNPITKMMKEKAAKKK